MKTEQSPDARAIIAPHPQRKAFWAWAGFSPSSAPSNAAALRAVWRELRASWTSSKARKLLVAACAQSDHYAAFAAESEAKPHSAAIFGLATLPVCLAFYIQWKTSGGRDAAARDTAFVAEALADASAPHGLSRASFVRLYASVPAVPVWLIILAATVAPAARAPRAAWLLSSS